MNQIHALPADVMSKRALCGRLMTLDAREHSCSIDPHYVNCVRCKLLMGSVQTAESPENWNPFDPAAKHTPIED